jgi:hypothetical protein
MAGRKDAYSTQIEPNLEKIKHWVEEGYSHQQIYKMLGVSHTVFYRYKNPNSKNYKKEFAEILEIGTQGLKINLEKALYKEAMGYEYTETTVEIDEDSTGVDSEGRQIKKLKKKQKKTTKIARPNANLLIFALCNKFPNEWKRVDKDVVEAIENNNVNLNITDKHIKNAFKALYPAMEGNNGDGSKNKKQDKETSKKT